MFTLNGSAGGACPEEDVEEVDPDAAVEQEAVERAGERSGVGVVKEDDETEVVLVEPLLGTD